MSIASELQNYANGLDDSYTAVNDMGGIIPAHKNMDNLDQAIRTIPQGGGSTPTTPTLTSATLSNGVITLTGTDFGSSPKVLMFNRKYDRYDAITPTTSSSTSATVSVGASDYGIFSRVVKIENGGYESGVKFVYADFEGLGSTYDVIAWCYGLGTNKDKLIPYGGSASNFSGGTTTINQFFNTQTATAYTATDLSDSSSVTINSRRVRGAEISPLCTDWSNITAGFLGQCGSFNQPIGLANLAKMTASGFLVGAYSFNSPIDVSMVTDLSSNFLRYCSSFNQPLNFGTLSHIIPSGTSTTGFMADCFAFNQPLTLRGASGSTIVPGGVFMYNCVGMASPITLENLTISGTQFLYNMTNLPCINLSSVTFGGTAAQTLVITSAMQGNTSAAYLNGVVINGDTTSVDALLAALPDISGTSTYRHLVRGTVTP